MTVTREADATANEDLRQSAKRTHVSLQEDECHGLCGDVDVEANQDDHE